MEYTNRKESELKYIPTKILVIVNYKKFNKVITIGINSWLLVNELKLLLKKETGIPQNNQILYYKNIEINHKNLTIGNLCYITSEHNRYLSKQQ